MIDFKKEQKEFYLPKIVPAIIDVPKMNFIVVNGKGDPNNEEFKISVELLYSLSYSIKMSNKAILEYVVPPLEGIWWKGTVGTIDKSKFEWAIMLRQPDFVTEEIFEAAKVMVKKKKKHLDVLKTRLDAFTEGLCAHVMHIGSYDDEGATLNKLEKFVKESGYIFDIANDSIKKLSRRHHEIYLSNPGKVAVEKMKTVIRYPIKRNMKSGK
jgi:hypothetical protein